MNVHFTSTTFQHLIKALQKSCGVHNPQLQDILDDYAGFLRENGLLKRLLTLVNSGGVIDKHHVAFGLYPDRKSNPLMVTDTYLFGLYSNKFVKYVCRVSCVVTGTYDESKDQKFKIDSHEFGEISADEKKRIDDALDDDDFVNSRQRWIDGPLRFYLIDNIHATSFEKISPRGIGLFRYFDLGGLPYLNTLIPG